MALAAGAIVFGLVVLWARTEIRRQNRELMKTIREVRDRWRKNSCKTHRR